MKEGVSYEVVRSPVTQNNAVIIFALNSDALQQMSLQNAHLVANSFCENCPFNPKNQRQYSPFNATCQTFNDSLRTRVEIPNVAAVEYFDTNAVCGPKVIKSDQLKKLLDRE